MLPYCERAADARPIVVVTKDALADRVARDQGLRAWVEATGFEAGAGSLCSVPDDRGGVARVLVGAGDAPDLWTTGGLPFALPEGDYRLDGGIDARAAAIGWGLGAYRFTRYQAAERAAARLVWPEAVDREEVGTLVETIWLCRDLINTPANDLGPADLADAVVDLAAAFDAGVAVYSGDALPDMGWPAVHAVGRASERRPHVADLTWGDPAAPKLTLIGKGVVFDSGGLDIKPASAMLLMKKDMGGAAHAIALARLVMAQGLPVRLRLIVPTVENAVAGNAFRPGDVLTTRKGLTVEVGNTDAEGRLILCDALAAAMEETPDLVIDFATLTGAARVALGAEVPAMFTNDEDLAKAFGAAVDRTGDPMWRLPLWQPYNRHLASPIADVNNVSAGGLGGAITAALFLERFVDKTVAWAHFDLMAWNAGDQPGRPKGGEAMALRAVFDMLRHRYTG